MSSLQNQPLPLGILINVGDRTDAAKYHPVLGWFPLLISERLLLRQGRTLFLSTLSHVESNGTPLTGWVMGNTFTPRLLRDLPFEYVRDRIVTTIRAARHRGARVAVLTGQLGGGSLGAKVVQYCHSEATPDLHDMILSTGNGYTVAVIFDAVQLAAAQRGLDLSGSRIAVVGGYGSIGRAVLHLMAEKLPAKELMVLGHRDKELRQIARQLESKGARVSTHTDFACLPQADVIVSVTNAAHPIILPQHLKHGAILCDAAAPRDVSPIVRTERPDVFLFRGGIVQFPSATRADLGYDVRLGAPDHAYACFGEGAILAFTGRADLATESNIINPSKVSQLHEIGKELGFKVILKQ